MAKLEIEIDVSLIVKAYQKGFDDAFIILSEFKELENQLDINKIDSGEKG